MTWTLNLNNPLHAAVIRLNDGSTFHNVWFTIIEGFVIVWGSREDKPTFYNRSLVDYIRGVDMPS